MRTSSILDVFIFILDFIICCTGSFVIGKLYYITKFILMLIRIFLWIVVGMDVQNYWQNWYFHYDGFAAWIGVYSISSLWNVTAEWNYYHFIYWYERSKIYKQKPFQLYSKTRFLHFSAVVVPFGDHLLFVLRILCCYSRLKVLLTEDDLLDVINVLYWPRIQCLSAFIYGTPMIYIWKYYVVNSSIGELLPQVSEQSGCRTNKCATYGILRWYAWNRIICMRKYLQ